MTFKHISFIIIFYLGTVSCAGKFLEKGGHLMEIDMSPSATNTRDSIFEILGRAEGESATFYLLGLFPVTRPLSIEYAMSQAVGKIKGGATMINMNIWHETHFYFPIGRVSVVKVAGDVVALKAPEPAEIPPVKVLPRKRRKK